MGMSMDCTTLAIDNHYESKAMADESRRQTIDLATAHMNARIDEISTKKRGYHHWYAFLACNLDEVYHQHHRWINNLPRVNPHYAVKCNTEPAILKLLAQLGTGFDCASMPEIERVLALGVDPSRIIYAQPRKCRFQAKEAVDLGVLQMTTDSVGDIEHAAEDFPTAELLIRIAVDDSDANCPLSDKYGSGYPFDTTEELLQAAKDHNLNIVGVSFHVGSDATNPGAFTKALKDARYVFDQAAKLGYNCRVLDIGGGFTHDLFEKQAACINMGLDRYFSYKDDLIIIGEPGRFYVSSAFLLATRVTGRRENKAPGPDKLFDYAIDTNEGVYGTLQNTVSDHQKRIPKILRKQDPSNQPTKYKIWGPTCDSYDLINNHCKLPGVIDEGDWLYFEDMGAYTIACASNFNSIKRADTIYFTSRPEIPALLG